MARVRSMRWLAVLATALLAVGLIASCSTSATHTEESRAAPRVAVTSTPAPPTPVAPSSPGEPAYCAAMRQLETDLRALGSANVIAGGLDALQKGVDKIQADLTALQAAAQADFGPQITALRASLTNFATAMQAAGSNLSTTTVTAVVAAAAGVTSSYGALKDALSNRCG